MIRESEMAKRSRLLSRACALTKDLKGTSLAEFTVGDLPMLNYFGLSRSQRNTAYEPTNDTLEEWIARLEEIHRRD